MPPLWSAPNVPFGQQSSSVSGTRCCHLRTRPCQSCLFKPTNQHLNQTKYGPDTTKSFLVFASFTCTSFSIPCTSRYTSSKRCCIFVTTVLRRPRHRRGLIGHCQTRRFPMSLRLIPMPPLPLSSVLARTCIVPFWHRGSPTLVGGNVNAAALLT